jgi:dihydrofolate reductase
MNVKERCCEPPVYILCSYDITTTHTVVRKTERDYPMANHVYVGTSLDGYIADPDGGLDWLQQLPNPDKNDFGWAEFISGIDAIVMGRNSYETVLSCGGWPYQVPVFVLSNSMDAVSEEMKGKAEIIKGAPHAIIERLNAQGYNNLYIDGGITIQSFLEADLIDIITITRIPVLLGGGTPLFGALTKRHWFNHIDTKVLCGELVQSRYSRKTE